MAGESKLLRVPMMRTMEPDLRRKRLLAARSFAAHSIPRFAILTGQWDAGSIVGAVARERSDGNEG